MNISAYDEEKADSSQADTLSAKNDPDAKYGGHEARVALEKKLLFKIDSRMSILIVIYILNYEQCWVRDSVIDSSQGELLMIYRAARLRGFSQDLNLQGQQFATLVFFLSSTSAILLCKSLRLEFLQSMNNLRLGSLMASGILSGMQGTLGHAAWRWLFYIEGALTVFVAICAIFILPDFPSTTKWLTPLERTLAMQRMEEDAGVGDQGETETGGLTSGMRMAVMDWRVWWMSLAMTAQVISLSFNAYFPTLSATMGFNNTVTLLLCAPPFVFAATAAFFLSRFAESSSTAWYATLVYYFPLVTSCRADDAIQDELRGSLDVQARLLYGLIHARWIVTARGLSKMVEKYKRAEFGRCPRVMCQLQPLLPVGLTDIPYEKSVKLYCGRCEDLYSPKSSRHGSIDGAYFGTTFAHLLFLVYPTLIPPKSGPTDIGTNAASGAREGENRVRRRLREEMDSTIAEGGGEGLSTASVALKAERYKPRIYGFQLNETAKLQRWQEAVRDRQISRLEELEEQGQPADSAGTNPNDAKPSGGDTLTSVMYR
ncbi:hypothetical protein D9757_000069 [Collybiopsis confluens]|uniref:Casein kinase II subunit beta n=1 Tax=Collybiopsis confluens TaxID=2823264 RepID=A0A8H5I1R7_9AGAR|nr:hypothetical protein D9757_000069 [Collybiopsis confluens]